jgi:hypothetical protein
MIRVLAQAGNRASKTGRYLQWWENKSEWCAMTSVVRNHTTPLVYPLPMSTDHALNRGVLRET